VKRLLAKLTFLAAAAENRSVALSIFLFECLLNAPLLLQSLLCRHYRKTSERSASFVDKVKPRTAQSVSKLTHQSLRSSLAFASYRLRSNPASPSTGTNFITTPMASSTKSYFGSLFTFQSIAVRRFLLPSHSNQRLLRVWMSLTLFTQVEEVRSEFRESTAQYDLSSRLYHQSMYSKLIVPESVDSAANTLWSAMINKRL
jgi:hypothetical protein